MATVKKHTAKNGTITYHIRCFNGYDKNGKQIAHSMTWKPDSKMTERQIKRELQKQVDRFEDSVKNGTCFDSKTTFEEYAEAWIEYNKYENKPKTNERYMSMLVNINQAIGNIRLTNLQSHHLNEFYNNLRESGIKKVGTYAISINLNSVIKSKGLTKVKIAEMSGLSLTTVRTACRENEHISIESAKKIANVLNMPIEKLFNLNTKTQGFSKKTIHSHHRLISSILTQAVRDHLIPFNVADRNHIKAPKLERKEADFLDDEQLIQVLELLEEVPIKWKTAMYLLIFTGMRRGELMGLEWSDIDFKNQIIHIRRTSQYVRTMGIITNSPKTDTSTRKIKISDNVLRILEDYKKYWQKMRSDMADCWQHFIEITLADGSKNTIRNDRLFIKDDSTPMHPDSITDWVSKFVKKNNLPHFTPHSLRHTHATLLIASGVDITTVANRLGHSNTTTTANIYSHAIQSAKAIAAEVIDDRLMPKSKLKDKKSG